MPAGGVDLDLAQASVFHHNPPEPAVNSKPTYFVRSPHLITDNVVGNITSHGKVTS
jgi:hypothetical protein